MNIFYLDTDPAKAAQYHCDDHVNKMAVEVCQMLSTAHYTHGEGSYKEKMFGPAYINHSVTRWVKDSYYNYTYASELFWYLMIEFRKRYAKEHSCMELYGILSKVPKGIKPISLTPPALAMPDCYKSNNPVSSYRAYYVGEKNQFANWRNDAPFWWPSNLEGYLNHVKFALEELQRSRASGRDFGSFGSAIKEQNHGANSATCEQLG